MSTPLIDAMISIVRKQKAMETQKRQNAAAAGGRADDGAAGEDGDAALGRNRSATIKPGGENTAEALAAALKAAQQTPRGEGDAVIGLPPAQGSVKPGESGVASTTKRRASTTRRKPSLGRHRSSTLKLPLGSDSSEALAAALKAQLQQ